MALLTIALTLFVACYILEQQKGQKEQDIIDDAYLQNWIDQQTKETQCN